MVASGVESFPNIMTDDDGAEAAGVQIANPGVRNLFLCLVHKERRMVARLTQAQVWCFRVEMLRNGRVPRCEALYNAATFTEYRYFSCDLQVRYTGDRLVILNAVRVLGYYARTEDMFNSLAHALMEYVAERAPAVFAYLQRWMRPGAARRWGAYARRHADVDDRSTNAAESWNNKWKTHLLKRELNKSAAFALAMLVDAIRAQRTKYEFHLQRQVPVQVTRLPFQGDSSSDEDDSEPVQSSERVMATAINAEALLTDDFRSGVQHYDPELAGIMDSLENHLRDKAPRLQVDQILSSLRCSLASLDRISNAASIVNEERVVPLPPVRPCHTRVGTARRIGRSGSRSRRRCASSRHRRGDVEDENAERARLPKRRRFAPRKGLRIKKGLVASIRTALNDGWSENRLINLLKDSGNHATDVADDHHDFGQVLLAVPDDEEAFYGRAWNSGSDMAESVITSESGTASDIISTTNSSVDDSRSDDSDESIL